MPHVAATKSFAILIEPSVKETKSLRIRPGTWRTLWRTTAETVSTYEREYSTVLKGVAVTAPTRHDLIMFVVAQNS